MRYFIFLSLFVLGITACKKNKFTTEPQIKFKSLKPNFTSTEVGAQSPVLTLNITDAEGDLGLVSGKDTSFVYLKNLLTKLSDSLPFPDIKKIAGSNFQADVAIDVFKVLKCKSLPSGLLHTDTVFFEVYVKDFAKNKSNVIATSDPVYYLCR
jgi:hypothetical protein